jgi:hypothetical protein
MNMNELMEYIKKENPKLVEDMQDKRFAALARAIFKAVGKVVQDTPEGKVAVPGLGVFVIKQITREKEGKKVNARVVRFRKGLAKGKAKT